MILITLFAACSSPLDVNDVEENNWNLNHVRSHYQSVKGNPDQQADDDNFNCQTLP